MQPNNSFSDTNSELIFKINHVDFRYEQHDMQLVAYLNAEICGRIDFSIYQDELHVKMVRVLPEYRRKNIGKSMILFLQSQYPNTELDLGLLTGDGVKLFSNISKKKIFDRDFKIKSARLKKIQSTLATFKTMHDQLMSLVNHPNFDEERTKFLDKVGDKWDDYASEEWELMNELRDKKEYKIIFVP